MTLADSEKRWAAGSSVIAAVCLTTLKIIVGIATGSLGILAEAAHSALDLAAAVMTLLAVRISGRPADSSHLYGHGKVENLSALFETLLLMATCLWIVHGALQRLITGAVEIEVNFWSFAVMATSIVVDYSRSRMLYKAAKKHRSQALEADALHFSTDVWSSVVVVVGLVSVKAAHAFPSWPMLRYADAIAALLVALIVIVVSGRLGWQTVHALVDAAPAGMQQKITSIVAAVPGVIDCHNVRLRNSGAQVFVDIHVMVDGNQTLKQAHDLTEVIERAIQDVAPEADVTVHPEPA
jgi:cation diffusion facilitator family transporter